MEMKHLYISNCKDQHTACAPVYESYSRHTLTRVAIVIWMPSTSFTLSSLMPLKRRRQKCSTHCIDPKSAKYFIGPRSAKIPRERWGQPDLRSVTSGRTAHPCQSISRSASGALHINRPIFICSNSQAHRNSTTKSDTDGYSCLSFGIAIRHRREEGRRLSFIRWSVRRWEAESSFLSFEV